MATSIINYRAVVLAEPSRTLAEQADAGLAVVIANGWAPAATVEQLRFRLKGSDGKPVAHLSIWLSDQKILTRDQAHEMNWLAQQGAYFPAYRLLKRIGAGGMGTVFLAERVADGSKVALKTINAKLADERDFIGRFQREADALRRIKHPYIAGISDSGENQGHCYLAMEFVDGPSTMHLLKEAKVLPEDYAIRIAMQIAEGLASVWTSCELIHRDLKPENILIARANGGGDELFSPNDTAKLIDFGLVKSANESDERLTQTGMTIGTPLYMSPEQVRGEKLDCRSDIYGLGATLYHFLTGATPYVGTSPGSIMSAHLTEPVPDPGLRVPGLNADTRKLVMTAMAKKRDERFRDHEAFAAAAQRVLDQLSKGGMAPKFLRKPLVLKGPVRKSDAPGAPDTPAPQAMGPGSEALGKALTARIQRSSGAPATAIEEPAAPVSPGRASTRHFPSPVPPVAGQALESRRAAIGSTPVAVPAPVTPPRAAVKTPLPAEPPKPRLDSAVFQEDPAQPMGMGMLPWIVLGVAVVALILGVLWLL